MGFADVGTHEPTLQGRKGSDAMLYVDEVFSRIASPKPDVSGLEIALLLEQLCQCSLNDDDDGVAACSAALERQLTKGFIRH